MSMPYYIEDTSLLWIKDNLAPFGTNIYFVQKISGFTPNGSLIFDFIDDFASYDTNVWTTVNGSPAVASSNLTLASTTVNSMIRSVATYDVNTMLEMKMYHASGNQTICGFWSVANNQACWLGAYGADLDDQAYTKNGTTATYIDDAVNRSGTTFYKYGVTYLAAGPKFYVNGTLRQTASATLPTGLLNISLYSTVNKGNLVVDWVRTRKYIETDPTVTVQTVTGGYYVIVKNNLDREITDYQISVAASSLGTLTASTSLCIEALYKSPLTQNYRNLFSNCIFDLQDSTRDLSGIHTFTPTSITKTTDRFDCSNNSTSFNGTTSRGSIAHNTDLDLFNTDKFTLLCWIKQVGDYSSSSAIILSKAVNTGGSRWNFHIINNEVGFYIQDADSSFSFAGFSPAVTINDGAWHLVCFVKNGTSINAYKDGAFVKTFTMTGISNFSNTNAVNVGCKYDGSYNEYFSGNLGEILIYNGVTFTTAQIKNYYDLSKVKYITPVRHLVKF